MPGYSSPLLDQYNQTGVVTPALQSALDLAKQRITARVNAGQPAPAPNMPEAPAMPMPFSAPAPKSVMGPAPAPLPLSQSPRMQNLQAEHDRLTDPTRASSKPGVEQIHNPWLRTPLRVLDAIGSGFFPGVMAGIPGTGLHHQVLVKQNEARQNELQKGATEEATRERFGAETQELGERGQEEQARANELEHAQPKNMLDLFMRDNPNGTAEDYAKFEEDQRPITNDFEAWAKQNPGKPVSEFLKLKAQNSPEKNETPFDVWRKANPNAPVEDWLNLSQKTPQNEYEDFKAAYKQSHPKATDEEMVRAYASAHQAPPQTLIVGPNNQASVLKPGVTAPEGFRTPQQQGQLDTPTTQMRNVGAQASLVHEQTPMMLSEIDRLKDKLGPMQGRWNDLMQGKVGMNDPDFAGLRADLLMYSSAVALMHARGRLPENLREEFDTAINNPGQDFANLKSAITHIDGWTVKNQQAMGGGQTDKQLPGGISLDDVDAEIARRKKK